MKTTFVSTVLVLGTLAFSSAFAASVYKWTDGQGNVHYGDKAPVQGAQNLERRNIDAGANSLQGGVQANPAGQNRNQNQNQRQNLGAPTAAGSSSASEGGVNSGLSAGGAGGGGGTNAGTAGSGGGEGAGNAAVADGASSAPSADAAAANANVAANADSGNANTAANADAANANTAANANDAGLTSNTNGNNGNTNNGNTNNGNTNNGNTNKLQSQVGNVGSAVTGSGPSASPTTTSAPKASSSGLYSATNTAPSSATTTANGTVNSGTPAQTSSGNAAPAVPAASSTVSTAPKSTQAVSTNSPSNGAANATGSSTPSPSSSSSSSSAGSSAAVEPAPERTPPPATLPPVIPGSRPSAVAAEVDFRRRCATAGVVVCLDFDSADDITPYMAWSGDKRTHPSVDTTIKASGGGSMKFDVLSKSGANTGGWWQYIWSRKGGHRFGPGDTLYVQFRQRFDRNMIDAELSGGGWKQIILHEGTAACASVEITTANLWYRGYPQIYTNCGAKSAEKSLPPWDFAYQTGDYYCRRHGPIEDCGVYRTEQWMTFYYEIKMGEWRTPTSYIKAYMSYQGEPLKTFVDHPGYQLDYNSGPHNRFDAITLTPYNTGKNPSHAHPDTATWYDELIVSTRPIPAPSW